MNRFKIVDVDETAGCLTSSGKEIYIVDNATNKFIVQCTNYQIAEMVCLALNYTQNEGLLNK